MKIIALFGPPGSGKGTQAEILAKNLGYITLSAGQLVRREIKAQSEIGKRVAEMNARGFLSDGKTIKSILEKEIEKHKDKNIILDGFPRTIDQINAMNEIIRDYKVKKFILINLEVQNDEIKRRIDLRSKNEGRADDSPEALLTRLEVYKKETFPVLQYYKNKSQVITINGLGPIKEISEEILKALKKQLF